MEFHTSHSCDVCGRHLIKILGTLNIILCEQHVADVKGRAARISHLLKKL